MSSGGLRLALTTEGSGSSTRTDSACNPRLPWATPNSTRVPCLRVAVPAGNAEAWTKTSPPSSFERKPKPLSASNHFTLPVGTLPVLEVVAAGLQPSRDGAEGVPAPYADAMPEPLTGPRPADRLSGRLVAAGGVVFLAGLLALGITLALWAKRGSAPGGLAALALLCPVGFGVAFAGLVVQARAGRR